MNNIDIEKRFMQRFMTWGSFNERRTTRANLNYTPPKEGYWCRVNIQAGLNMQNGVYTKPCTLETGLVIIQLFTPENKGTKAAKELADSLGNHLQYYSDGRLELNTPSGREVGALNGFYQYNVTVPYDYFSLNN